MGDVQPLEERGEYSGVTVQLVKTIGIDKSLQDYHQKILSCEARNPETGQTVVDSTRLNIICMQIPCCSRGISYFVFFSS